MKNVEVKTIGGNKLPKKIFILALVMISIIIIAVIGYLVSFYSAKPKITSKQGAVSYVDVDETKDVCADVSSAQSQKDCLDELGYETGELSDLVNSL